MGVIEPPVEGAELPRPRLVRTLQLERFGYQLALVLAAGAAVRLGLAILFVHRSFDLDSIRIVDTALRSHFTALYTTLRWPYPGGLLPWVYASGSLARATGVDISVWFKLPTIAADLGIAYLVQAFLALRGAPDRTRLVAAALVCLGPSFVAISGYDGQIDALAILPAVAALYVWGLPQTRPLLRTPDRRELVVALLIGLGAAVKTVPLLMLLVFVPRIKSWSGRVRFCAVAFVVPALSVLPWVLTRPHSLNIVLNYTGIGVGPLALAVQPSLAKDIVLANGGVRFGSLSAGLEHHGKLILLAGLVVVALLLLIRRPRVERAALLVWLTAYAFMPFFFFQYVVWGLPFLLIAGYLRAVVAAQAIMLGPLLLWEGRPWHHAVLAWIYVVPMTLVWVAALVSWLAQGRRVFQTA